MNLGTVRVQATLGGGSTSKEESINISHPPCRVEQDRSKDRIEDDVEI